MLSKIGRFFLFFFAFGIAIYAMNYWNFEVQNLLHSKSKEELSSLLFRFSFYGHVIFGPIALMAGPFQFMPNFRNRNLKLHRNIGKIYVLACLISGVAGLSAAQYAEGGITAIIGFSLLAISWLFTTGMAWSVIKRGDVIAHEKWMLRSFALTLSAVTLRLWLLLFQVGMKMEFLEAYRIIAWLCWVPNLIIIEWWIRKRLAKI